MGPEYALLLLAFGSSYYVTWAAPALVLAPLRLPKARAIQLAKCAPIKHMWRHQLNESSCVWIRSTDVKNS
jgi:hypothetical protein